MLKNLEEQIRMEVRKIQSHFEENLTLTQECRGPSSWWTSEMIMLNQEENLPLDMRLYLEYETCRERKHDNWHFLAPWHVFRLPCDTEYLIAQSSRSHWLTFNIQDKKWKLKKLGQEYASYNNFQNIISNL